MIDGPHSVKRVAGTPATIFRHHKIGTVRLINGAHPYATIKLKIDNPLK